MKQLLMLWIAVSILCAACDKQETASTPKQAAPVASTTASSYTVYSYQQYEKLFDQSSTNLVFLDAHIVDHTTDTNLVAIDPADSFNTRSFLTKNGEQSNETTQKQLIYKDNQGDAFTVVDVIYLQHSLGKDMISWPSNTLKQKQNEPILDQYDTCLISYNNILIQITRISKTKPLNLKQMKTKISAVTDYLQKELN